MEYERGRKEEERGLRAGTVEDRYLIECMIQSEQCFWSEELVTLTGETS